jgi:acyl-coenzyme A synthetase/AMP-(fatty) acid ligase
MISDDALDPEPLLEASATLRSHFIDAESGAETGPDEVRRAIDVLALVFSRAGIGPGAVVLLAVGNGPLFLSTLVALVRVGACPLLLHASTPRGELARLAARWSASFAVGDARGGTGAGVVASGFDAGTLGGGQLLRIGSADGERMPFRGVPLHPTSGTSGLPRLAARPAAAALAEAQHYGEALDLGPEDVVLATVPTSHAYGFGVCAMTPLVTGASVVSVGTFNPNVVARAIDRFRPTLFPTSPVALDLLIREAGDVRVPIECRVLSAGAPLGRDVSSRAAETLGVNVRSSYGTTETGVITLARGGTAAGSPNSVGHPISDVEIEIRPGAADAGLVDGVGTVAVRSSSLMAGYVEAGSLLPATSDGWFDTRDLGTLDDDGALTLLGRLSEAVNVAGLKVLPLEVEEVIAQLPQVDEVKVYGRTDPTGSAVLWAAVVASSDLSAADVRAHCATQLAPFKRPREVSFVDELPRSAAGKVLVDALP